MEEKVEKYFKLLHPEYDTEYEKLSVEEKGNKRRDYGSFKGK